MIMKHGPRVQLHYASPEMIVREVLDDGRLVCEWMENGSIKSGTFPLNALKSLPEHAIARKSPRGGYQPRQRMTVLEHLHDLKVRCCWFEAGVYKEQVFGWIDLEIESWMNSKRFGGVKIHVPDQGERFVEPFPRKPQEKSKR